MKDALTVKEFNFFYQLFHNHLSWEKSKVPVGAYANFTVLIGIFRTYNVGFSILTLALSSSRIGLLWYLQ